MRTSHRYVIKLKSDRSVQCSEIPSWCLEGSWFKGVCAFPRPKMHPFGWRKSSAEICLIRFELKPESKSDRSASVQLFRPIPTLTSTPTPTPLKSLFLKTSNFRRNSSFCIGGRSLEAEIMTLGPHDAGPDAWLWSTLRQFVRWQLAPWQLVPSTWPLGLL